MPCDKKLAFCAAFLFTAAASPGSDWTVLKEHGRDYVTFANVAQFYQFSDYTRVSRTVSLRSDRRGIRAQAGTNELYINDVRFFTYFPIVNSGNDVLISSMDVAKLIEPIMRPSRIQKQPHKVETVVLDPGHGGADPGAKNRWGTEKDFALDVAQHARLQLMRAGFKVEMTRSSDVTLSLEERVNFANRFPNALFISIHFNSSGKAEGLESYALAPAGVTSNASNESHPVVADVQWCAGNAQDNQNIALTAAVHAALLSRLSIFDRGVRHARFHVLRDIKIPAMLLECGYLSSLSEGQRIATAQFRQQTGEAIAQAVQNYDAAVNYRASGKTLAVAKSTLPPHAHSITDPLSAHASADASQTEQPSISINGGQ